MTKGMEAILTRFKNLDYRLNILDQESLTSIKVTPLRVILV